MSDDEQSRGLIKEVKGIVEDWIFGENKSINSVRFRVVPEDVKKKKGRKRKAVGDGSAFEDEAAEGSEEENEPLEEEDTVYTLSGSLVELTTSPIAIWSLKIEELNEEKGTILEILKCDLNKKITSFNSLHNFYSNILQNVIFGIDGKTIERYKNKKVFSTVTSMIENFTR
jgi:hypothetical protein